ncbi:4-hydroxy-3-methylbut-2-enyl diphosphate reductase [Thermophilibacter immobilis]|jgi:4-hydroxy-3-methylbut-2-enyl diphosphate reductase|uniref:4-hydroxy-3-methylbut-2-enyl diphosphate reductase n=1 Tax=Thermophilibacter immobilis TaxID=2779519 RepID=A0A7S7RU37_9ACTN|nr:4-hydroxy-3-methylbut-2-enyl diphosphate reductase [Thermophilibacter immobilis]QOY59839.1 4-hydroxy-3-methylbut-2-enyl diphosphate reductase [Thermophilibacter immobilis]
MAPRILIAREAGACYGVERALEMVDGAAEGLGRVHTLGPLIHNPRVVADLAARGVSVVSSPEGARGDTLLLRTHGTSPDEEARARALCARVLDATCPFVKKAHVAAARLASEGYQVVVVGEAGHPEVEATLAHAPGAVVVGSADEARALPELRRVGVVVQTTARQALLAEVVGALVGRAEEVRVINTICEATSGHQEATDELAREADVMVVIGGRISANTTRLAEISAARCPRTHHVEGADELEASWFEGAQTIGITAGASTPASQIEAVRERVEELVGA